MERDHDERAGAKDFAENEKDFLVLMEMAGRHNGRDSPDEVDRDEAVDGHCQAKD